MVEALGCIKMPFTTKMPFFLDTAVLRRSSNVCSWQILLQKSAVTDGCRSAISLRATRL